eukprot:5828759-Amphidinium_carterae.1
MQVLKMFSVKNIQVGFMIVRVMHWHNTEHREMSTYTSPQYASQKRSTLCLCSATQLHEALLKKGTGRGARAQSGWTLAQVQLLMKQMLQAVAYLHSKVEH